MAITPKHANTQSAEPPIQDEFLSPINFIFAGVAVIGGVVVLAGMMESSPLIADSGIAIAGAGLIVKGIDLWRKHRQPIDTETIPKG